MGFHGRPWFYDHGRVGEGYILPPLTISFALHNFYEIKSHHHIKSCLYLSLTKYSSIASPTLSTLEAPASQWIHLSSLKTSNRLDPGRASGDFLKD